MANLFYEIICGAMHPVVTRIYSRKNKSKLLKKGNGRSLYRTRFGDKYWLTSTSCVDLSIIGTGYWEPASTEIVKKIVKNGNVVLDVGANIGYYSVILSKLVGENGTVIAFEPTKYFGSVLKKNIEENNLHNCVIKDFGLSDKDSKSTISIGDSSATLHWVGDDKGKVATEEIEMKTLDGIVDTLGIDKLDFIKIDVDGHEPAFLKGAISSLRKYKPTILLEVASANYLKSGVTAWDFYSYLRNNFKHIYFEDFTECKSEDEFLLRCGNFAYSANILVSEKEISEAY